MNQEPAKIVIAGGGTGGHVQPAIAVTEVLRNTAAVDISWIGSRTGVEEQVAREHQIPFQAIPTGKLRRYFSLHTAVDAVKFPTGIVRARMLLRQLRPDVVFSTGGFVSVPTVIAAWLAGIPVITHEQTATLGLANRINARFSNRIALAFDSTRSLVPAPPEKIVVTGNPVRSELLHGDPARARSALGFSPDLPVIYVTGGSLGAHAINETIRRCLDDLVTRASVIHQCGPSSANGDFPRLLQARKSLPDQTRDRYVVRERIGNELTDIYAAADVVISRSGAGTVAELAFLGKPSILIPLPGTSSDEQTRNAHVLQAAGGAIVIDQSDLSPERLLAVVDDLLNDDIRRESMAAGAKTAAQPDAATKLTNEILKLAGRAGG